ncbi:MAG: hypothetical protein CMQ85_03670 [Gammaproteobacteria bacterium]|nr:hypothetical protein [Gammaproteobacteria bacterium]|tara:strand:+ start:484 stop:819 length:336 start_codon:yes stop_codon:yes gene_type:complete
MSQTFKITYFNHNSVYEIYSKEVYQSDMYGFIVVENLVFGENTSLVVDPSEEKLKTEFENVKRFFVPAHNIIRIDEVEKEGVAKITSAEGNVKNFPSGSFTIPPTSNNTEN